VLAWMRCSICGYRDDDDVEIMCTYTVSERFFFRILIPAYVATNITEQLPQNERIRSYVLVCNNIIVLSHNITFKVLTIP